MRLRMAILALVLSAGSAWAWPVVPGIYGGPVSGPVLNSVAVSFGNLTPAGRGGVRLSSSDNTQYGFHFSGLDIQSTSHPPCSAWTVAQTGGTAGHWTLPSAGVSEGPSAITPVPSAAGVTAHLNGGPYTFSVNCTDVLGQPSTTGTLTVNITTNAYNFADTDVTTAPASFGSVAGAQIFLSTGANRTGIRTVFSGSTCNYANTVTIKNADNARPAGILNMEFNNCHKFEVDDMTFTGSLAGAPSMNGPLYVSGGASDGAFNRDHVIYSEAVLGATQFHAFTCAGASNITIADAVFQYVPTGLADTTAGCTGLTVTNPQMRYIYDNFIVLNNCTTCEIDDPLLMAPMRRDSIHIDDFQIADGGTPSTLVIKRLMAVQADGNAQSQGPLFGGTPSIYTGYISSGAGSSTPGHVLTTTVIPSKGHFLVGATITGAGIPAGTLIASGSGSTYQVTLPSGDISAGTPASPISITGVPLNNWTQNGTIYAGIQTNGITWAGETGTSALTNFDYIKVNPQVVYATTFTGTISGTTLTITNGTISGIAGIYTGMKLTYSGCSACLTINSGSGLVWTLSGSASVGPVVMSASDDGPEATGPRLADNNTDITTLHSGTMTIGSGYVWDRSTFTPVTGSPCVSPDGTGTPVVCPLPANTTVSNVVYGCLTSCGSSYANTQAIASFANGNPETSLEAISQATWAAKTATQVRQTVCDALIPKSSGPLDAGGGTWLGALKPGGSHGIWNDGSGTSC